MLNLIDEKISQCTLCNDMVEHFPAKNTVQIGRNNNIAILGEAPANNGWSWDRIFIPHGQTQTLANFEDNKRAQF